MTNAEKVYEVAKSLIGQHVIPLDASTEFGKLGCAASVNAVWTKTFGRPIGGGASTAEMLPFLEDATRFLEVPFSNIEPGCVVICATGTSKRGPSVHGHVSIAGKIQFMSNSSETGTWQANFDRASWIAYYEDYLRFRTRVFKIL